MKKTVPTKLKISIQGRQDSYHHQAALKLISKRADIFGDKEVEFIFCASFNDTYKALKEGEADLSLMAIENGVHGHIYQVLDILMTYKPFIIAEVYLPIHHQLASKETDLSLITDVYSHFAAFPQCSEFLSQHLPEANQHVVEDTAWAATYVQTGSGSGQAAICSLQAAESAELNVLGRNIENHNDNVTRFFLLSLNDFKDDDSKATKTSLILNLSSNVAGALYKALGYFYNQNLNLSCLTSRPGEGGSINYRFYLEIEASAQDDSMQIALESIKLNRLADVELLGSY